MKRASNFAFLSRKGRGQQQGEKINSQKAVNGYGGLILTNNSQDLNFFVVTFDGMKNAEQNISGGDPYECKKCNAVLNKFSQVLSAKQYQEKHNKQIGMELQPNESFWQCEFCLYPNHIKIQKEQIPKKDDVVYMLESAHEIQVTQNDSTIVFCIDTSGSMNTTSQIQGKVDLKYGLSQEQIQMLRQFMEPGDQVQFNFLPGQQNQNKTFISRKQCILSAIESQLLELKKMYPHKKVGFITFNSQVTVLGDEKTQTVNILGDKLYNKQEIINSLKNFKINSPIGQACQNLVKSLGQTQAKGQTALGPALISAIQVASKGSPGSTVILCTDGLANIGVGSLDPFQAANRVFYDELSKIAKQKNVIINLITIKGQSAKMQIIGQLAKNTNGNVKVVNPQKIKDDFANILKDQVVGLNVTVKIMLHKAMVFRHQGQEFLKDNKTVLVKELPNATVNTRVSFEYELRCEEDIKFMEIDIDKLKTVPFQAQITYTSSKGGKFLRVISSQSITTTEKQQMKKNANIGVVHQRIASNTASMFQKGESGYSLQYNGLWADYLNKQFTQKKYEKQQQAFNIKNKRLNNAIQHKSMKMGIEKPQCNYKNQSVPNMTNYIKMKAQNMAQKQEKSEIGSVLGGLSNITQMKEENLAQVQQYKPAIKKRPNKSVDMDSDEQEQELMQNAMQKQCFDLD